MTVPHRDDVAQHAVAGLAAPKSAPELALRLEALLGQHSLLAADFMRGRIRGDDDFAQAANAALGKNTDAMGQLMGDLFGAGTAKKFAPLWAEHIVELFTYARGLADQDTAVRAGARKELIEYEQDLAAFFVDAAHGRLTTDAANRAMQMHVDHLLMQADAYAAKDYPTADRIYRESYEHTYDLGATVAGALLAPKEAAALQAPIWRLRSQLGRLLAEHVVLVEDLTRAAVTNTPDFSAAGQIVNGNTSDLAAAMDSLFGAAAAKDFQSLWGRHVEQLMAYASATAAGDSTRREQARTNLGDFEKRMAAFLESATGKRLGSSGLAKAFQSHDQMLLRHADAFAAKDYGKAHDIAYETYEHMFELAHQLADAFGATVAARLPSGGVQTGYGGMADAVERR
ncbi:MAG TPA: hypothetical protein VGP57_01755 [Actinoplanes sp.]|nr:hypothetical protein [Actinoplanes sp.]